MVKKFSLSIIITTCNLVANAQPVIDSGSFLQTGQAVSAFEINPTGLDDGNDGANCYWDFSDVDILGNSEIWQGNVQPASSTEDYSFFPEANIALILSDGTIRYWNNSETGLAISGQGGTGEHIAFTNESIIFTYPFSFGSVHTDDSEGTIYGTCRNFARESTETTEGTGYGTLALPNGIYDDVLKIRRTIFATRTDTERGTVRMNNIVEHYWFHPDIQGPLLYLRNWSNDGCPGSNEGAEAVLFMPQLASTSVTDFSGIDVSLSAFPNPASNQVQILIQDPVNREGSVQITDMIGQFVWKSNRDNQNDGRFSVDLSGITPGVYLINYRYEGQLLTQRLVIQ